MGLIDELHAEGYKGDALVRRVMELTGLDEDDAHDLIATETDAPMGDLIEEDQ
jgi:hypothetical protein